jgi:hypothetical protein
LGPSIVYSERTNEELEALFRTIVDDDEFLNVCQEKFGQVPNDHYSPFILPTNKFDYEEIPTEDKDQLKGRVVHEINMSVYYNVEVDRNNSDLTFVKRYINVIPEENSKKNRFSNLNLSNNIDRFVKIHDYVHHSQQEKKSSVKRRSIPVEPKRRSTISSSVNQIEEYDSAVLAHIVEQQLAAAAKNFSPITHQYTRIQPPVNRAKFIQPPILIPKANEHYRVDHIEYPKGNLNSLLRKPIDNRRSQVIASENEREKLVILGQQGIISSAVALGSQRIPDNIKTIELLEIPTTKPNASQYQDFHLISYETLDNYPPVLRRIKSTKNIPKQIAISSRRSSTIIPDSSPTISAPLKNIKRNLHHKNETVIHNKQVFKEKSKYS